jgi:SAM-dependent methyltransferase
VERIVRHHDHHLVVPLPGLLQVVKERVDVVIGMLINQAAGGYLDYNANTCRYYLPPEHAAALGAVAGAYYMFTAAIKAEPRITVAFKTGQGMLWSEHDAALFAGTERFFRPGYEQNLVPTAGLAERVTFEVAGADAYPAPLGRYDLVAFFDSLHDMGDPVGAIRHAASTLTEDGTVLLVEPMAGEQVEDNLNPVGRVYAAASVLICTPHAVAEGGTALGTIATEAALREVVNAGGLSRFRRATETPFNRVFEARR